MKYKVTSKHPELKEGIKFEFASMESGMHYSLRENGNYVSRDLKHEWINNEYCEEIQEPKWTDDDCKDLIRKSIGDTVGFSQISDYAVNKFFDEWKNSKQL